MGVHAPPFKSHCRGVLWWLLVRLHRVPSTESCDLSLVASCQIFGLTTISDDAHKRDDRGAGENDKSDDPPELVKRFHGVCQVGGEEADRRRVKRDDHLRTATRVNARQKEDEEDNDGSGEAERRKNCVQIGGLPNGLFPLLLPVAIPGRSWEKMIVGAYM